MSAGSPLWADAVTDVRSAEEVVGFWAIPQIGSGKRAQRSDGSVRFAKVGDNTVHESVGVSLATVLQCRFNVRHDEGAVAISIVGEAEQLARFGTKFEAIGSSVVDNVGCRRVSHTWFNHLTGGCLPDRCATQR